MLALKAFSGVFVAAVVGATAAAKNVTTNDLMEILTSQNKILEEQAKQIEALLGKQAMLDDLSDKMNLEDLKNKGRRLTAGAAYGFVCDTVWITASGALVMFMQAGFAVLEAGSVRAKNCGTVLLKNFIDVILGTLAWYVIGWGIAYGVADDEDKVSNFAGSQYFAGSLMVPIDETDGVTLLAPPGGKEPFNWFFQWAFCATAATIVSGGVAERIRLPVYILYSVLMTGVIYPFIVYWTWSGSGFLTDGGYSDFAGSGIVHLTGGIAALAGAVICGSRKGRFERPEEFYPHNMAFVVLGTFILWFGWYGFNCGSTLYMKTTGDALSGGLVAINTTMSAATGGLTVFVLRLIEGLAMKTEQLYDLAGMCNGILAGLVAVCAGVGSFDTGIAMLVGAIGAIFYEIGHWILLKLKVDDPLDAFSVHGMAGMAGLLLRPLICMGGADGKMFVAHIMGLLTIVGWSGGLTTMFFFPFRILGILTYSEAEQEVGTDVHCSPPKAYSVTGEVSAEPQGNKAGV